MDPLRCDGPVGGHDRHHDCLHHELRNSPVHRQSGRRHALPPPRAGKGNGRQRAEGMGTTDCATAYSRTAGPRGAKDGGYEAVWVRYSSRGTCQAMVRGMVGMPVEMEAEGPVVGVPVGTAMDAAGEYSD